MTKRKRFSPSPEVDSLVVLEVAREIENIGRVSPPTAAELAERQRQDREHDRQRRERQAAAEQAELEAEQIRLAEEAELDRQQRHAARVAAAEQSRLVAVENSKKQQYAADQRRMATLANEWSQFKVRAAQEKFIQQRDEYLAGMQQSLENLSPEPHDQPANTSGTAAGL
jgi:hypothetical protein